MAAHRPCAAAARGGGRKGVGQLWRQLAMAGPCTLPHHHDVAAPMDPLSQLCVRRRPTEGRGAEVTDDGGGSTMQWAHAAGVLRGRRGAVSGVLGGGRRGAPGGSPALGSPLHSYSPSYNILAHIAVESGGVKASYGRGDLPSHHHYATQHHHHPSLLDWDVGCLQHDDKDGMRGVGNRGDPGVGDPPVSPTACQPTCTPVNIAAICPRPAQPHALPVLAATSLRRGGVAGHWPPRSRTFSTAMVMGCTTPHSLPSPLPFPHSQLPESCDDGGPHVQCHVITDVMLRMRPAVAA
ncbi:hypothetical protein BDN70DRAFT_901102 [Pholiota conissans]|uniref:Uncharacterized protein n=1 Tax=Pholiota conissans TaxID=109636 RepID=A0A9P6CLZ6_9AGAR|nr:hypothetical protein BDN70DRAFT_901102 [Pholiota conissans]